LSIFENIDFALRKASNYMVGKSINVMVCTIGSPHGLTIRTHLMSISLSQ